MSDWLSIEDFFFFLPVNELKSTGKWDADSNWWTLKLLMRLACFWLSVCNDTYFIPWINAWMLCVCPLLPILQIPLSALLLLCFLFPFFFHGRSLSEERARKKDILDLFDPNPKAFFPPFFFWEVLFMTTTKQETIISVYFIWIWCSVYMIFCWNSCEMELRKRVKNPLSKSVSRSIDPFCYRINRAWAERGKLS